MAKRVPIGSIAAAAMLVSHWAAYLLAAPDPHERAHLLQATGHAYWPFAMSLAVGAAVLGLGTFIGRRLSAQTRTSKTSIFGHALPRFLALQVGGFATLEIVERVLAGHSFGAGDLVATTFLVGIAIQVVASVLSTFLLVALAYVVDHFVAPIAAPSHDTISLPLVSLIHAPRLVPATGAHSLRGPPVSA
jgi:hypothetical protein